MKKIIISILALILAALGGSQVANLGGSASSLPAAHSTSSTVAIGEAVVVLFPPSRGSTICASRQVINRGESALYISFLDTATGTLQTAGRGDDFVAASSTKNYPAEDYGCGGWIATLGDSASSTASVTEFRQ